MKEITYREKYRQIVENKFHIYNSLFMNLPFNNMNVVGGLISFLYKEASEKFPESYTPVEIVEGFLKKYSNTESEKDQLDLLFRIIQYVERQVVLFDSIEDSSSHQFHKLGESKSLDHIYRRASQSGQLEAIREKIQNFGVRVVFTAHPTQFYPKEVLGIIEELREAIQQDSVSRIDINLRQLGKTPFIKKQKPTPYDEAISILYFLRNVYYKALGDLYARIQTTFFDQDEEVNPNILQLGFWPGGDRDGNPFVTADITRNVADELRYAVLKCYYNHLKKLRRRLTFKGVIEPLNELSGRLYANMFGEKNDLKLEEIIESLDSVKQKLIDEHDGLFLEHLQGLINRVKIFGLHFASLDVRQDSRKHHEIIRQIVEKELGKDYDQLSDEEKIDILINTELNISESDYEDELTKDTILNVNQIREIQQLNGERGLHRYIISNSEDIFAVLHVYALFKFCGYGDNEIPVDIAPLFETISGMDNSRQVMQTLYNLPKYRAHVERRGMKQDIMLGFSDGTKDGGYLKANLEIYQTKETLTKVSEDEGILVKFFDGRGGPPARGGGKSHMFYAAQGSSIANNEIQLTIQGQTITSMYGTLENAQFNFEQLLTAGLSSELDNHERNVLDEENRSLFVELANLAFGKYADLKNHPNFVPYLEKMSTLKYYGRTNIGSRPAKRGASKELKFSDLRAISFVSSWSMLKQNVPGYYGVGTALKILKEQGRFEEVKRLYENSSFFKSLILNSQMSMQKTYFPLTYYMKDDAQFGEFWTMLHDEFLLTRELVLELSGFEKLMETEVISRASVLARERIVLPLLAVQQYALQKIQEGGENKEIYEKLVTRSLFGNINASRNSA